MPWTLYAVFTFPHLIIHKRRRFARDATILRKAGAVLLDPVSRSTTPLGRLLLAADAWRLADPDTARVLRSAMDDHVSKV